MRKSLLVGALLAFAGPILLGPTHVAAHHTWVVQYERGNVVVLEGTVTEVRLTSPHSRIFVAVEGPDGPQVWAGETWPLAALYRRGLTNKTLSVGDTVRVTGERATNGRRGLHLRTVYRPADDWRVWIGLQRDTGENTADGIGEGVNQLQLEDDSV